MSDECFSAPQLAGIYDVLHPNRNDLEPYLCLVRELGARRALDIGCGTGVFALLMAARGLEVIGVDPAEASIDVARAKPGGHHVHWISGDATALADLATVDVATMTGNVAQAIVDPLMWRQTLRAAYRALRPGGHLIFETRNPAMRAWQRWNRAAPRTMTRIPGGGVVESWPEVISVELSLVTFRSTYVFAPGGQVMTSESTLRFREQEEVKADLTAQGFTVAEVRDAPDRPGKEFVFIARRQV
ncbi:class I SAM-dependent methyltransferase [Pseudonocardia sp. HH130630-07]|uniref:class I SAM-dependent methyltransferase n=1 Tax=Pseudonocardia sp. HH130630-07 TaxID=1690815 RepID=UPI00081520BF|nr:class I SAM-dependent methyltransferase [Pseudonocardia sp. HH130630-07]ANY05789.1 methyltransferase type 11 [Pseudonocardia sp. HH130630-07]